MGLVLGNAEQLVVTVITAVASGGTVAALLEWLQRRRETSGRVEVVRAEVLWDKLFQAFDEQQEQVAHERARIDQLMQQLIQMTTELSAKAKRIEEAVSNGGNVDSVGRP